MVAVVVVMAQAQYYWLVQTMQQETLVVQRCVVLFVLYSAGLHDEEVP